MSSSVIIKHNVTMNYLAVPSPPNNLICTNITSNSITLQWSPPTDNGGTSISHYIVTWSPNSDIKVTEDMSLSITGLSPNTEYIFTVSANNSVGIGNGTSTKCTTQRECKKQYYILTYCFYFLIIH